MSIKFDRHAARRFSKAARITTPAKARRRPPPTSPPVTAAATPVARMPPGRPLSNQPRKTSTMSADTPADNRTYSSDVAFTPAVKAIQLQKGSRVSYARMEHGGGWETTVTPQLAAFLSRLDMFYLGPANALGQPYIQYRGGSPGFLRVVVEQ